MSAIEESVNKEVQELKNRTDATIGEVTELSDKDMENVSGGYGRCSYQSSYACAAVQCDTRSTFDCKDFYRDKH